ncbi:MAG: glycoside hydrolase family 97 protein [Prevotellaceae bacterium]|nr:glycoside hydrolase family 97 protein [Candidatus Minthosoma caballi]
MKNIIILLSFVAFTLSAKAQIATSVTSPNGKLKIEVNADKQLKYSVIDNGNTLIKESVADLVMTGKKDGKFTAASKQKLVKETTDAPLYKMASVSDEYNQIVLKNSNGMSVELRAYNSGVAYRWITSNKGEWTIDNEVADFNFADDYPAYMAYSTNEKNPKAMAFQATYEIAPLSQSKDLEAFLPITVDCGSAKVTILESDVEAYPGIFVKGKGQSAKSEFAKYPKAFDFYPWRVQKYVTENEPYIAKGKGARNFPWRVMVVTHDDTEMPTNTLVYSLASPNRIGKDLSWIKPGKVAWDWWNDWGVSEVSFKAGINQDTYKYYIDFAAKNGLEYIILDEGWYDPKSGDMLTVINDINLPALVEYGKRKNVGIILWTVFNVLDSQLDEACEKYAAMGIKGFKVDFLDRFDQEGVEMIYRIADRCAKSKLMLDYHGIFPPAGINRTYPNVINFESVFGMEEVKWTQRFKGTKNGKQVDEPEQDMPKYDVTFPYIRMMAGYVDFTPGGMRNATAADFQPVYNNPMTMGTRCHQLAHYIVHDSPLTMLADNPTIYMKEKECTDFICSLPTVYDEMRCIKGKMGEYIVIARRQGNDWYVAGETSWDARDIELSSDFLPVGTYEITAFMDGVNAEKNASDYQTFSMTAYLGHDPRERITVHLASGGGFAAKLIKQ